MRAPDLFLILIFAFLMGCTTIEDCQNDPNRAFVIIEFVHDDEIVFDSITYNRRERIADDTEPVSALGIFLDPNLQEADLMFFTDSIDYELVLSYNTQVQIFEIDCPPSLQVTNLDTVRHGFRTLQINRTTLTNTNLNGDVTVSF